MQVWATNSWKQVVTMTFMTFTRTIGKTPPAAPAAPAKAGSYCLRAVSCPAWHASAIRGSPCTSTVDHVGVVCHVICVQVLKTTVSLDDPTMPGWSELANDIVVNEKTVCQEA